MDYIHLFMLKSGLCLLGPVHKLSEVRSCPEGPYFSRSVCSPVHQKSFQPILNSRPPPTLHCIALAKILRNRCDDVKKKVFCFFLFISFLPGTSPNSIYSWFIKRLFFLLSRFKSGWNQINNLFSICACFLSNTLPIIFQKVNPEFKFCPLIGRIQTLIFI